MRDCKNWRLDPGRTNYSLGESPAVPFDLLWRKKISGDFPPCPPLNKIGNKLFFTDTVSGEDRASLYCVNSDTGEELWRFQNTVAGATFLGGVSEETAILYQGTGEGGTVGVGVRDGSIAWHNRQLSPFARFGGVVDGDGIILFAEGNANSRYVCTISHKTGGTLAQFKVPFYALEELAVSPSTICGIVVTEERTSRDVVALSRTTGEVRWTTDVLSLDDAAYGPPDNSGNRDLVGMLMADGRVFVTQSSGKLWCLDERTGALRWNYGLHHGNLYVPAYADQKLYFRKWEHFICLDANTGKEIYAIQHNGKPAGTGYVSGTVAGDCFFFSDTLAIFALDRKDGSERWRHDYGKKKVMVWGPYIVSDGRLYVAGSDNYISCFGAK
jgi:outer membrane protein assembly factor BamB